MHFSSLHNVTGNARVVYSDPNDHDNYMESRLKVNRFELKFHETLHYIPFLKIRTAMCKKKQNKSFFTDGPLDKFQNP